MLCPKSKVMFPSQHSKAEPLKVITIICCNDILLVLLLESILLYDLYDLLVVDTC